jgi:hypothetical protein
VAKTRPWLRGSHGTWPSARCRPRHSAAATRGTPWVGSARIAATTPVRVTLAPPGLGAALASSTLTADEPPRPAAEPTPHRGVRVHRHGPKSTPLPKSRRTWRRSEMALEVARLVTQRWGPRVVLDPAVTEEPVQQVIYNNPHAGAPQSKIAAIATESYSIRRPESGRAMTSCWICRCPRRCP